MIRSLFLVFLSGLLSSSVFAQTPTSDILEEEGYSSYYQITEPAAPKALFATEIQLMPLKSLKKVAGDLLRWALNRADWPSPEKPYNRRQDFGTWLRDEDNGSCLNTRAHILIRESHVSVTMDRKGCRVVAGEWDDPYTGETFTRASQVQIDHMVPLKNAYVSGAWQWTRTERCAYANFMANRFHLVAVSAHENMSKGDRSPADWLPPNEAFTCNYLKDWLSVKLIWGLIMGPREGKAIKRAIHEAHCNPKEFEMSPAELADQRWAIQESLAMCQ